MKYLEKLILLQQLAKKIDHKHATDLESKAFDCIMEMIHENIKDSVTINAGTVKFERKSEQ